MAKSDPACPICDVDLALAGDERPGDEVFCSVCGAPVKLLGNPDSDECEVEADF